MKRYGGDRKLLSLTVLPRGKIEYLSLIDTRDDKVLVSDLSNGSIVDMDVFNVLSVTDLTINVVISNIVFGIESIKFMTGNADNTTYVHVEGNAPFAFFGNYQYDFSSCPFEALTYGTNLVTVTTHSKEGGLGEIVETYQVSFTIHGKDPIATTTPSKPPSSNPSTTPSMMETKNNGTKTCTFPEFIGDWEWYTPYPINVAEAIGGVINGSDLIVISGFANSWESTTRNVYTYSLASETIGTWKEMDPIPVDIGLTHSGYQIVGHILYLCGGYIGGNPGKETSICLMYNHRNIPSTQWSFLPSLPEGRAGGALLYNPDKDTLLFATGATRSDPLDIWNSTDYDDVWELHMKYLFLGWKRQEKILYRSNHVSHAVVYDRNKQITRYFVFGGQVGEYEYDQNLSDMFEWDPLIEEWIRRHSLPAGRGHMSSSTIPYYSKDCIDGKQGSNGIIIAGGAINGGKKSSSINYYDIYTDRWNRIGMLPMNINTPVCDIATTTVISASNRQEEVSYMHCQSGLLYKGFSWRRIIQ